ncbi:hypothetical protein OG455_21335 [Kitasatospora sp. NBC_01287]|uniref:hypothetical protein n=1 Tax=Kitasatospora sp. NBC_01287 TaxID=2903573 RepID=UPI0022554E9A|nr:hypothetical protein [Kitasatospora sp. NBC_01287]MCX4748027.1 hypothetical protein [Kitasatospora sp. NBC_01287]
MPTHSTAMPAVGPRHAAPDDDRLGTFLTACWAALHLPVLALLGLMVHSHPAEASAQVPATAPDLPVS